MGEVVEIDCTSGEVVVRHQTADEIAAVAAAAKADADAKAAQEAKDAAAKAVLANNPDLKTILDALGLTIG